ncbi:hypothetical protein PENTCL1PPCAC_17288 [Pristionchus entomophagus]|uniref:Uncharacterized protein n=1 Tax=Pristionchus entomophagus TaxID=358040 RepID=A0AAV5TL34_9BILA|nr:hypothetical protein PENTCL1PPCAC_17288 [Pristionchus entomophagus]
MTECSGVQIAASVLAGITFVFSIAACFIPVVEVEEWIKIILWVYGGINAVFAILVLIVLFTHIRWFLLPKIAIGFVNIAFFASLLTLSIMTITGTNTLINNQIQWYYDSNEKFRNWIDSFPDGSVSKFSKEIAILGVIITVLLLIYSAIAAHLTVLVFLKLGKKSQTILQPLDENVKVVPITSSYDHSTLTGGYGPLLVSRPVIIVKDGAPVYGTSPPPYVD